MLKLEIEINEVDYPSLITALLPYLGEHLRSGGNPLGMLLSNGMSTGMAKNLISKIPPAQLDALIADTINANGGRMSLKAEEIARQRQINIKVSSVHAEAK